MQGDEQHPNDHAESDHAGSDHEDGHDSSEARKSGRKTSGGGSNVTAQARRDQNRIAQREFRLRKQQQIKDLQTRVELLSGNRDERQEAMSLLVKNLLTENAQLRKLVKDLSSFVGEGLATFLPRLGLSLEDLDAFMNRPETAPAHEAMDSLRAAREKSKGKEPVKSHRDAYYDDILGVGANQTAPVSREESPLSSMNNNSTWGKRASGVLGDARSGENDPYKRARVGGAAAAASGGGPSGNGYDEPFNPMERQMHSSSFPGPSQTPQHPQQAPQVDTTFNNTTNHPSAGYRTGVMNNPSSLPVDNSIIQPNVTSGFDISDSRQQEAMQLIGYHLTNYRANNSYVLPPSLRPTQIQKNMAHEHIIDGVIFPSLRDKLILLRGRYDVFEAFHGMLNNFTIPGEDTLDHRCWEVSETWLRNNVIFWDKDVLEITNAWRAKRGDKILTREDLTGE